MDDRQIQALDNPRLAALAGLEEALELERELAIEAWRGELAKTPKCPRCSHQDSEKLKALKLAKTYAIQGWGAAARAAQEIVRRIDPEKRAQKKEAEAARVRATELGAELRDAKRAAREAEAALGVAEEDPQPDRTLVTERKGALKDALARVKELGKEIDGLAAKQTSVARLLERAVREFIEAHRPKGKALEQIEQEFRAAILPKPAKPKATKRAAATA